MHRMMSFISSCGDFVAGISLLKSLIDALDGWDFWCKSERNTEDDL